MTEILDLVSKPAVKFSRQREGSSRSLLETRDSMMLFLNSQFSKVEIGISQGTALNLEIIAHVGSYRIVKKFVHACVVNVIHAKSQVLFYLFSSFSVFPPLPPDSSSLYAMWLMHQLHQE